MRNAWNDARLAVAAGFSTDPLVDELWRELQKLGRELAAERAAHAATSSELAAALVRCASQRQSLDKRAR